MFNSLPRFEDMWTASQLGVVTLEERIDKLDAQVFFYNFYRLL